MEQNITFTKNGNSDCVHQKIMEAFPMPAEGGGYEILRAGQRSARQLMVIAIPPGGYTVSYLKSTIASAKGYVRPLQRDTVLKPATLADPVQSQVGGTFKKQCKNITIKLSNLREINRGRSANLSMLYLFPCVLGNRHTNMVNFNFCNIFSPVD